MSKEKIAQYIGNWAWLCKVVLFVIFCFTTGIPQWITYKISEDKEEPVTWYSEAQTFDERIAVERKVREFHQGLRDEADSIVKVNGWYSPYDYFDHLDRGYCFDEQSGISGTLFTSYDYLMKLCTKSWKEGPYSYNDITLAKKRNLSRFPEADPNNPAPEIDWRGIGNWFWLHYLYALPLALLWFLVNIVRLSKSEVDLRDEYKLTLRSPVSLILATFLYPLYFGWRLFTEMRQEGHRVYTEAEIRSRKEKFLTLLGEDERALVTKLVRERAGISEIRESVSQAVGSVQYRGIFASVIGTLIVMVITSISPKTAQAVIVVDDYIAIEYEIAKDCSSYESTIGFGYDHHDCILCDIPPEMFMRIFQKLLCWPSDKPARLLEGPPDTIFHVPVFGLLFQLFEMLNQKLNNHEKYIVSDNSMLMGSCFKSPIQPQSRKRFNPHRFSVRRNYWDF